MTFQQPATVYILGGSLTGLMHAATIARHSPSSKITILERSPSAMLHNQGAGVVASPDVTRFFDEYVRCGRDIAVVSKERLYLDRRGNVIQDSVDRREQRMTSWDVLYRMLRWRVDGLDADEYFSATHTAQPPRDPSTFAEYRYGCNVEDVSAPDDNGPLTVRWTDGKGAEHSAKADLVVAADGASSSVRAALRPDVKRSYAGYVALRGTCPERSLSRAAADVFSERFAFYHGRGTQDLAYLIPGTEGGTLTHGQRMANWVWYVNFAEGDEGLESLMTGPDGVRHRITLPPSAMRPEIWEREKARAKDVLPPQFAELVEKTDEPFVQAVTDVVCDECLFFGGRLLMVGDSLAGFRPHTAASTGQAAFDALRLGEWMQGSIDRTQYRDKVLQYSRETQKKGVELGERSQFGKHPFDGSQ